ncbi:MAG: hypothetical protein Q8M19_14200 [Reyranella sp.]|nr:hypothetical protein [Reyranella sp.]
MTTFSLYARMKEQGTLTETAADIPDSRFALPSTIHWMRALAILAKDRNVSFPTATNFYVNVQRRPLSDKETNSICEQLLFALHQLSSLQAMLIIPNKADVARIAIVAWYYGVYGSASAMIAAADGSFPDTHAATARQWDRQLSQTALVMPPFADRLSQLVQANVEQELAPIRARGTHSLTIAPTTAQQAWGCHAEYLSGTAEWEQWNIRERIVDSREFKDLHVTNFRTGPARTLRDSWYAKRSIAFLHEASRYRGKANYRDAIFLAYGRSVPTLVDGFVADLTSVLLAFSCMAAAYASKRMGTDLWLAFLDDIEAKRSLSISPKTLWS